MKNWGGLLYVIGFCLAAATLVTCLVVFILMFYSALALLLFWVMIKSYLILGNTWFFILWPLLIFMMVITGIYKGILKRIPFC